MGFPGFAALGSAWLFFLIGPLVLFYFLKLKRPRLDVPCLVLWKQVLQDSRVNSPFQRFKRNILLWLQLLLLILLILAGMQPFWPGGVDRAKRLPILIDCSASMAALDKSGGVSRLEAAKERVRTLIDGMVSDQKFCLISFAQTGRKLTGFTDNKRLLLDALDKIEVRDVPSDVEDALRIAQALSRREPFDKALLLSDGNFPERTDMELAFGLDFQKLPAAGSNMGITTLNATRTGSDERQWVVFVTVGATSEIPSSGTLELLVDDQVHATRDVTLSAERGERWSVALPAEKAVAVQVRLKPNGFDSLAADNVAYLDLALPRQVCVYAPTKLTTFRLALQAMRQVRIFPEKDQPGEETEFDLVITDRPEDLELSADTSLLVGMVPEELQTLVSVEKTNGTLVIDWRRDVPLLQHVQLADLVILDNPRKAEGALEQDFEARGYEVLAHGQYGPVLLQKDDGSQLSFHLLFHTDRSTLPYRVGFPILVANAVRIAMRRAGLAETPGRRTGVLPPFDVQPSKTYQIKGPGGIEQTLESDRDGVLFGAAAPLVGRYRISGPNAPGAEIGVSLLNSAETLLQSAEEIHTKESSVAASQVAVKTDRSFWRALALTALLVLLIEWWYYQRKPGGFRA